MEEEILYKIQVEGDGQAVTSIENLTKANKALREERKKLNLDTAEGRARVEEINKSLDANTEVIKKNVSSLEKQRMNVGAYFQDIKKSIPFFQQAEQAQKALSVSVGGFGKALIATGIGAFIVVLGSLIEYFKSSEEGQDRLAKITAVLGVAMNKVMVVIESTVGAVIDAITGTKSLGERFGVLGVILEQALVPFKLFLAGLEKISEFTGLDKVINDTLAAGQAIADAQDAIESRENELIVRRAEVNKKVQELREKAITQEGALKRKTIEEAIALEKALAAEETKQAQAKLDSFELEAATTGKLTEEQKKQRAELTAAVIEAQAQAAQATIKFQKEVERLNEAEVKAFQEKEKKKREALEETDRLNRELAEFNAERAEQDKVTSEEIYQEFKAQKEAELELEKKLSEEKITIVEDEAEARQEIDEKQFKFYKKKEDDKTRIARLEEQNRIGLASAALGQVKALFKENTLAYKALAIGQAIVDTYRSAVAALAPPPTGAGPLFGPILAGSTVALGLANVAKIAGVGFAKGGRVLSGTRINGYHGIPINRDNGDNLLATVKTGEVILNERHQALLGGANTFKQIGVPGFADSGRVGIPSFSTAAIARTSESISLSREVLSAITQIRPVVTVEDINLGQNRVQVVESGARVI